MVEDSPTSIIDETIATGDDTGAGGGRGAVDVDVEEVEMQLTQSALRDNISKKGKNAYYYAHAHKATGPEVGTSTIFGIVDNFVAVMH
jgi:hypothetical protein